MRGRVLLFLDEVDSGIVLSIPPPFLLCLGERLGPRLPRLSCDGMPAIVNAPQLEREKEREREERMKEGKEQKKERQKM